MHCHHRRRHHHRHHHRRHHHQDLFQNHPNKRENNVNQIIQTGVLISLCGTKAKREMGTLDNVRMYKQVTKIKMDVKH